MDLVGAGKGPAPRHDLSTFTEGRKKVDWSFPVTLDVIENVLREAEKDGKISLKVSPRSLAFEMKDEMKKLDK